MRVVVLLVLALPILTACLPTAEPSPVEVIQYPPTWTPAPTPTNTPLPPTATLVIQRTPGAVATRDPNARALPSIPRNEFGLWLAVTKETLKTVASLVPRANVLVTDGLGTFQRNTTTFVILSSAMQAFSATNALPSQYNGVVVPAASESTLRLVRDAISPRVLLVSVSVTETQTLDTIAQETDGVLLENFLTEPDAPLSKFPDLDAWKRDIDALAALSAKSNYIVLTSTRPGKNAGDSGVTVEQWLQYALASFLLAVKNNHSFFGFESALPPAALDSRLNDVQIGTPLGSAFQQNGVYQRRFTRGLVMVNPGNEARAFVLPRTYADFRGTRLNDVNLLPHTGMILLNVE